MFVDETLSKIEQMKNKIYDLQAKNDFSNMTILNF